MKKFSFLPFIFFFMLPAYSQVITTIAGTGIYGFGGDGEAATVAEFRGPTSIAVDNSNNLYISDNYRIRKVSASGVINTIAGTGTASDNGDGGPATAAEFNEPIGIAFDSYGNIYLADILNSRIRKINTSGIITTIAGTGSDGYNGDNIEATAAELWAPTGVAADAAGDVYIADGANNRIRKVNASGIITTIAGTGIAGFTGDNGQATLANLNQPICIATDSYGNVYFSDYNHIRKVNATGIITTIAGTDSAGYNGDGFSATLAKLNRPFGIALDKAENIYIADEYNHRVRKISSSGTITTIAGTGTAGYNGDNILAVAAELNIPNSVAVDDAGNIYISDAGNNRVRYIRSTVFVNTVTNNSSDLNVYPNPSNGSLLINVISGLDEQVQIVITNVAGEIVKECTAITNKPVGILLNVPPGVYFVSAATASERWNKEIVVNK